MAVVTADAVIVVIVADVTLSTTAAVVVLATIPVQKIQKHMDRNENPLIRLSVHIHL
jgi:hypothetical protein